MFLRTTIAKGNKYLNIVESYREGGKNKQRNIASLGRVDKLKNTDQLQRLAKALLKYCERNRTVYDLAEGEEKDRRLWGPVKVVGALWKKYGLDKLLKKAIKNRKVEFDFLSTVFLMVMDRLIEPKSKLKTYEEQYRYHGIQNPDLQHLYRSLDLLADSKEKIEEDLFQKNRDLFNMKVDVVFYDVTTIYFESVKADDLKEFGFSKDCKFKEVQVVLGLLVDMEGRPIGFDIFPGSTFEGHTLKVALEKLKKRFEINRLIIVGDRAMISKDNIETIQAAGYEYIVGYRAKGSAKKIKEEILSEKGYKKIAIREEKPQDKSKEVFKYKEIGLPHARLVCFWSSKRAHKDRSDRERLIEKAKKIIGKKNGQRLSQRGALKYIQMDSKIKGELNVAKIKEDEEWDGYYALQTNCKNLTPTKISQIYHDLWRVEESFRILKSHLEVRPVFVWTSKRILGHFVLCFIAFLLERTLELELRRANVEHSPDNIRKALGELQFSEVEIEGEIFYFRSKVEGLAEKILRILKLKIPPKIAKADKF